MSVGGIRRPLLQPLSGDFLAKFVFKTQPVKFAAMEGQFKTERHAPLSIGGWPDAEARTTRYAIEIPGGLSFLATRDPAAEVPGLDRVQKADWPNVEITHLSFQIMVGSAWLFWAFQPGSGAPATGAGERFLSDDGYCEPSPSLPR